MLDAMIPKSRDTTGTAWPHVVLLLAAAATGCAPDAMNNRQATGFNGYLNTLAANCRPLLSDRATSVVADRCRDRPIPTTRTSST